VHENYFWATGGAAIYYNKRLRSWVSDSYRDPLVEDFMPAGRSEAVIYAVALKEHPGVTKVGRTCRWRNRRKVYESWNLRLGAIAEERLFVLTDEYVHLPSLETYILANLPFERHFGNEWFAAEIDDVAKHIDRMLCEHEISYL
jgi:hypothetical protein